MKTDYRVLIQLKESAGYACSEISLLTYVNLTGESITLTDMRDALRAWEAQSCAVSVIEHAGRGKETLWKITPTGMAKLAEKGL